MLDSSSAAIALSQNFEMALSQKLRGSADCLPIGMKDCDETSSKLLETSPSPSPHERFMSNSISTLSMMPKSQQPLRKLSPQSSQSSRSSYSPHSSDHLVPSAEKSSDSESGSLEPTLEQKSPAAMAEMVKQGDAALASNDFKKAEACYTQAVLNGNELDHRVWCNMAAAFFGLNRLDEALESVKMCLKINPKWSEGWHIKGSYLTDARTQLTHLPQCLSEHTHNSYFITLPSQP